MKEQRLHWTGYSKDAWLTLLNRLEETIRPYGFITDVKPYSDLSVSLRIETESRLIAPLEQALGSIMKLETLENTAELKSDEVVIMLHVNLGSGSGDRRHEIPAVPG